MADERKKSQVIGEALARAIYDMPRYVLDGLNKHGYTHSNAMQIARRMVRELDHAGWQPKVPGAIGVRELEDQICMGLSMANCSRLCSQSPQWSKEARDGATKCICSALAFQKVVLVRRNQAERR